MNSSGSNVGRRIPALFLALQLCAAAGLAGAQALSPGATPGGITQGQARPGQPALTAPASPSTAPASPQGSTPTPLPGQSTMGSPLPPLNATGVGGQSPTAAAPGSLPTRSSNAAEAFMLLDRGQAGYVTRADTDRIPGFVGFDNADTNRDGQLTREEFVNAWRYYSGQ